LEDTVNNINENTTIHFDRLERYLKFDQNLFKNILGIVIDKNEKKEVRLNVWMDFFSDYFDKLGNDIKLIEKAYLQQEKLQTNFDYYGKGLLKILNKDSEFLIDYTDSLFKDGVESTRDHKNFGFVWQVDKIEQVLVKVFDLVISKNRYSGILEHFCNSFFRNLTPDLVNKANSFLIEYLKANHNDPKKGNVIVDIVRHSMKGVFDEVLLLFLSLNQDVDIFSKIWWRGHGGTYSGNVIIGDIEASEWRNILSIVEKSDVGIKLIPIKKYVNGKIECSLRRSDWERERRFLERDY
jgi:hypothetical protein